MTRRKLGTVVLFALGSVAFAPFANAVEADDPTPATQGTTVMTQDSQRPSYYAPKAIRTERAGKRVWMLQRTPRDHVDPDAHYFASTGGIPY